MLCVLCLCHSLPSSFKLAQPKPVQPTGVLQCYGSFPRQQIGLSAHRFPSHLTACALACALLFFGPSQQTVLQCSLSSASFRLKILSTLSTASRYPCSKSQSFITRHCLAIGPVIIPLFPLPPQVASAVAEPLLTRYPPNFLHFISIPTGPIRRLDHARRFGTSGVIVDFA